MVQRRETRPVLFTKLWVACSSHAGDAIISMASEKDGFKPTPLGIP
jgi:hypothetical protein